MDIVSTGYRPALSAVREASQRISEVVQRTPLTRTLTYSSRFSSEILFKREDLQQVRSYKIRGAFNKISRLSPAELSRGVVCASAGNHAQGVAFACQKLQARAVIYMPVTTPRQKVEQTRRFGQQWAEVILHGDSFDEAETAALEYQRKNDAVFIHPFDDKQIIEGQATLGLEILEQAQDPVDYIFAPLGGGGLLAGVSAVVKQLSPKTRIIGVEPMGAASMSAALNAGSVVALEQIEKFIDGAAVQKVGNLNFDICRELVDQVICVPEGKVCQTILDLYTHEAIIAEPAGALALAGLESMAEALAGKRVVCLISGGNNDITRTHEIEERALLYAGLKHYFVVRFPQRAGALEAFAAQVLGPDDDIVHFEYSKKHHREKGPAVVGIELKDPKDFSPLLQRMKKLGFFGYYLNEHPDLFQFLV